MHDDTARMIREALEAALHPLELEVTDDSWKHAGHAGNRGRGGHFSVRIRAECFRNAPRLARHRMIHEALAPLLRERIHALSITALASDEG